MLVDPEANAGIASVRTAQIADAADFIRTARLGRKRCDDLTRALNDRKQLDRFFRSVSPSAGRAFNEGLLGMIRRSDGTLQVTYADGSGRHQTILRANASIYDALGWPL